MTSPPLVEEAPDGLCPPPIRVSLFIAENVWRRTPDSYLKLGNYCKLDSSRYIRLIPHESDDRSIPLR